MKKHFITLFLITANITVFLIMFFSGVKILNPSVNDLIKFGANFNALLYSGEYFRLITHQFVHGGIIHLIVNMAALYSLGSFLEERLGKSHFIAVYILSGIAGGLLSASWHSFIVSTGASGAIMGLAGADLALIIKQPSAYNGDSKYFIRAIIVVLINLIVGYSISFIDNAAHIGGLLFGFAFTYVLNSHLFYKNLPHHTKGILSVLFFLFLFFLWTFNLPSASYRYYVAFNKFINYESSAHNQSEGKGYMETDKYIQQLKGIKKTWFESYIMLDTIKDMPEDLRADILILRRYSYYKAKSLDQYIKAIGNEEYQLLDSMEFTNALLAFLPKVKHGIMPGPENADTAAEKNPLKDIKIFYDQHWNETDSTEAVYYREAQVDSLNRVNGRVDDYYKNGQIQMKGFYLNDLKNDIFRYYYSNGNYESLGKYVFEQPTGKWKNFYRKGQIKEEIFYTDQSEQLINFWDSLGLQLIYNGSGIYISYNPDGYAQDSGMYLDGLKSGTWLGYYSEGIRYYTEDYLRGRLIKGISLSLTGEVFYYTSGYLQPEPSGGMKSYGEYLENNLAYPEHAASERIEGDILVDVTIDTSGNIVAVKNLNKLGFGCEEEAIRLVKAGPGFAPAREKGQIVQASKRIIVKFDLRKR
ncbi:MAG: rhomboid family intramembrane serine protease [Bacteroidota bacterium]